MRAKSESRKAAIVEAAASVFLEMGYEGTSMNEVTKRVGGSKTTVYGYFSSKQDLFKAVIERYAMCHLTQATRALHVPFTDIESFHAMLLDFAKTVLNVLTGDAHAMSVYRLVVSESGRSQVGEIFHNAGPQQCLDALSIQLREAMELGVIRQADPDLRAKQLLSLITAECDDRVFQLNPTPVGLAEITSMAETGIDMFLLGAIDYGMQNK